MFIPRESLPKQSSSAGVGIREVLRIADRVRNNNGCKKPLSRKNWVFCGLELGGSQKAKSAANERKVEPMLQELSRGKR